MQVVSKTQKLKLTPPLHTTGTGNMSVYFKTKLYLVLSTFFKSKVLPVSAYIHFIDKPVSEVLILIFNLQVHRTGSTDGAMEGASI